MGDNKIKNKVMNWKFWKNIFSCGCYTHEPEPEAEWVGRHKQKAVAFAKTHKKGTRVVAQNKSGVWKAGEIIGEHDWALMSFYFMVKFDDGEIIKQEERKVNLL